MNCLAVPSAIDGAAGVTAIDTRAGTVTVSVVDPLTLPDAAAIVVVPWPTLVASPPLLIVAVAGVFEDHVTLLVNV